MNKVKIKQFKNKDKKPVAGLTPEHAVYDKNGVRLDAKLGNVNLQEFRDLQQQCINNINTTVVEAKAEIDTKYEEVSQLTQASMVSSSATGLSGNNVEEKLIDAGSRLTKLEYTVGGFVSTFDTVYAGGDITIIEGTNIENGKRLTIFVNSQDGWTYAPLIKVIKNDSVIFSAVCVNVDSQNKRWDYVPQENVEGCSIVYVSNDAPIRHIVARFEYAGSLKNIVNNIGTNVHDITKSISSLEENINNLDNIVKYATFAPLNSSNTNDGFYISNEGVKQPLNDWFYSNPIKVSKGDVVKNDTTFTPPSSASIVSEVDASGNYIKSLYIGKDVATTMAVTIKHDCYICISSIVTRKSQFKINFKGLVGKIDDINNELNNLDENPVNDSNVTKGYYLDEKGIKRIMSGYFYSNPIKVLRGDVFKTTGSFTPSASNSVLSIVDESGKYVRSLIIGTGQPMTINYTIPENCYICISSVTSRLNGFFVLEKLGIENRLQYLTESSVVSDSDTKLQSINSNNPLEQMLLIPGYGSIIRKWGFIGDSLSSGETQCYAPSATSATDYQYPDMYQYSWGQQFMRIIGADGYNFTNGGQDARGWCKGYGTKHDSDYIGGAGGGDWRHAKLDENLKDAYIISLGINDQAYIDNGTYTLGNVADIISYDGTDNDINSTSKPLSFVRYYAGIIQRIKTVKPKAKIFCVTVISLSDTYNAMNEQIKAIVDKYSNCYLIDFAKFIPKGYDVVGFRLNGHLSAMGYMYFAYMYNTYIDWIIKNNANDFRDIPLIGTDLRPDF